MPTPSACWLLKTEPSQYSADKLRRDKTVTWDGISNPTALKHLRAMGRGDRLLIYHTADQRQAVALATVARAAYAQPGGDDPRRVVIDIRFRSMLPRPVLLSQIKADPAFDGFDLIRMGRLSVVPVPLSMWDRLMELSGVAK